MGVAEIGVFTFIGILAFFAYKSSKKVSQTLKK